MLTKSRGTYTLRRLFPSIHDEELRYLEQHASLVRLRKGQTLFVAGDIPRAVYGVANGCLKIVRQPSSKETVITRIVRPGQIAGIREVFGDFNYSRTGVALKDSEVFSINAQVLQDSIGRWPGIALQFMKIFSVELARMEQRIENDMCRPAKSRVASVVIELYQLFGDENNSVFDPFLSRREIAELADVTPETVSRSLNELKLAGALESNGQFLSILDLPKLQLEAEDR